MTYLSLSFDGLVPGIHSKALILSLPLKALCQSSPQILVPQASFVAFFFQKKSACGIEMVLPFPTGAQSS